MSLATVMCRACVGVDAKEVRVEVHLSPGLPSFSLVGLPEVVVRESKERVRSAIINSKFAFPMRRITVNLAPADLPKQGGRFDLAIALGILAASKQLPLDILMDYEFAGELALSGELRPIRGIISWVSAAIAKQRALIIPVGNVVEANLIFADGSIGAGRTAKVFAADHLLTVCSHLRHQQQLSAISGDLSTSPPPPVAELADVRGQDAAKRALLIAAVGGHHALFSGSPGVGKSMLAMRMPALLPPMGATQAQQVATIHSLHQSGFRANCWRIRPFRAPHHSASMAALVGGGRPPGPGEVSLAHAGVLFLDEFPEFNRMALESLREPLETGAITLSRVGMTVAYPAQFQLLAAMNPCPCGYATDTARSCRCAPQTLQRYQDRLSGPLFDRIDLQITVPAVPMDQLLKPVDYTSSMTSSEAQKLVISCIEKQQARGLRNRELHMSYFSQPGVLTAATKSLLDKIVDTVPLSARALVKILRVARSIADIDNEEIVSTLHIQEAFSYRALPTSSI